LGLRVNNLADDQAFAFALVAPAVAVASAGHDAVLPVSECGFPWGWP
jgi:hypothetical protein